MGRRPAPKTNPKWPQIHLSQTQPLKAIPAPLERSESPLVTSESPKVLQVAPRARKGAKKATPAPEKIAPQTEAPLERRLAVIDLDSGENLGRYNPELLIRDDVEHYKYSHSQIQTYNACSAQSLFRSLKAPAVPQYALERGSCAHAALEKMVKEGKDPTAVLTEEWKLRILDHLEEFRPDDQEKIAKGGFEETKKMLDDFVKENRGWFGRVRPEDVEVKFELPIEFNVGGHKFKRLVLGYVDLLLWNADRTKVRIFDYKAGGRAPSDDDLELNAQFALYTYAIRRMFNVEPDKVYWYHLQGEKICKWRVDQYTCGGDKKHKHTSSCVQHKHETECYRYAIEIPVKTDEEIQTIFNTYHGPLILAKEAGIFAKQHHDVSMCGRCQYKPVCDKTESMPLPKFSLVTA